LRKTIYIVSQGNKLSDNSYICSYTMKFEPDVWGPHYWFFLHTIAMSYPEYPNATTKRKYYDLIQNFPMFIPDKDIGDKFSKTLDKYPVRPYLDNRDSFVRWVCFIHNKYNEWLKKPEISLAESYHRYLTHYTPKPVVISERIGIHKRYILAIFVILACIVIYNLYG